MTATEHETRWQRYALARTPEEFERLREQARVWEDATGRVLDRVRPASGQRCLDAGCGPGETMRLLAERVAPTGEVVGLDVDATLAEPVERMLRDAGHGRCSVVRHDLTADEPVPGAPFDLVYARLLVFHLPQRVAVLRRLWDAVAPGGCLVVQDYDFVTLGALPPLDSVDRASAIIDDVFGSTGCDVRAGTRMPELFEQAGIGSPDGTDVAGRLQLLRDGSMLAQVLRSVAPAAVARGLSTPEEVDSVLADLAVDALRHPLRPLLWPLMVGTWKRRPAR